MNLKDGLNFATKLTLKRVWNGLSILGSYGLSKITKEPNIKGLPLAIGFEPTTSCNLRCPECPSGLRSFTRPTGMLQKELYERAIEELKDTLIYLTFYFQGEPYLHPDFLEMVKFASERKIYTATSTNAHYLTPNVAEKTVKSGIDRMIVSIDGTTQETYQQYRVGGKLDKVLEGTKNLIAAKKRLKSKTPHVIFQFLVVKPNEHQIADVYKLADELGVDEVKLKTAQIYEYENGNELIPTIDKYSRYKDNQDGTFSIKNKLLDHCWKMWHSCVITWDGALVPCCFDKDAEHPMGTLQDNTFKEVWNSPAYTNFRKALISSRSEVEICKNCSEGALV
ncbi:SPASM domain-containing protein [Arcticibacterium luteifluviistationis]|uniref:Radical SAM protein n=1 Tax=Arcticibacterium luteifluviistationis TaxID=1784714 RepID=A0A2Z4GDA7_9BACT|nr:radical SAM protein [Arcticibacterium luteifluviistationis]AWV99134.1 radical SAM protein [Arcticibacterium luteifluviistationis]